MPDLSTLTVEALRGWQQRIEHRLEAFEHAGRLDSEYTSLVAQWDTIEREWTRRYGLPVAAFQLTPLVQDEAAPKGA
jgi:hypothetical protein